jgi:hypothetical protein
MGRQVVPNHYLRKAIEEHRNAVKEQKARVSDEAAAKRARLE